MSRKNTFTRGKADAVKAFFRTSRAALITPVFPMATNHLVTVTYDRCYR
jgi:hypothetical protein